MGSPVSLETGAILVWKVGHYIILAFEGLSSMNKTTCLNLVQTGSDHLEQIDMPLKGLSRKR